MKKLNFVKITSLITAILILTIALGCMLTGCMSFTLSLDDVMDELFVSMFSGDALSINILLSYPEALDLDNETASLPTPSKSAETYKSNMESLKDICTTIAKVKYSSLSDTDKCNYDTLMNYFYTYSQYGDYYYFNDNYLSSTGGWNVYLPIYLDKYALRNQHDIANWLNLAKDSARAFPLYIEYEQKRIDAGYARAQFVYDGIAEQATTMAKVDSGKSHFLIGVFSDKIAECSFLTEEQKIVYISQAEDAINNYFIPAYNTLAESASTLVGKTENLSLCNYENGKSYYELLFKDTSSSSDSVDTAYNNLTAKYNEVLQTLRQTKSQLNNEVNLSVNMTKSALEEYYSLLKTAYTADFPSLPESVPTATLKEVPSSMADFYNPASYFKSAIDNPSAEETIYINSSNAGGYYGFDIISHEGIPGHQLQHAYYKTSGAHKIRTILGYTGYAEGWASHAQYYSAKYFPGTEDEKLAYYCECLYDELITYLYTIIDIEINYYGKTMDDLLADEFYSSVFSGKNIEPMYEYMIENPAVYSSYGYGCYKMSELRANYSGNDLAFHTAVLTVGPTTYEILAKYI